MMYYCECVHWQNLCFILYIQKNTNWYNDEKETKMADDNSFL